ncbi:methyltransferase type 12 [Flavobacteriales bacterium 34_180_T64]|nr:methyltransferase type 12 [Flavobacteriales bacterium 34_180_T64]
MKIKDNIATEFDEFSKDYTNDMIRCVPYYAELISSFTEYLPSKFNPKTILDLGCGNGNVTNSVLKKFPQSQYILLDASQEMLNLCQKRFKNPSIEYIASYFQDYEFKKNAYDFIIAGFSMHHCGSEEKKNIFKKIYRALKPGGIFSCSDLMINRNNSYHPALIERWKTFVLSNYKDHSKWEWLMEHYNEFDKPDGFKDQLIWLKEVGFKRFNNIAIDTYWMHFQAFKD